MAERAIEAESDRRLAERPVITSEKLIVFDSCHRRFTWTGKYAGLRISPVRALYAGLDAGLTADSEPERAAEKQVLALAAHPGLDIEGEGVYAVALHYAKLAGLVSVALRSAYSEPWRNPEPITLPGGEAWQSGCYDAGDGVLRRIALVDGWTDNRKEEEMHSWRTVGEAVVTGKPIVVTAVTIGTVRDRRRHSAWTRCYRHPRNRLYRMKRKTSEEDFSQSWNREWREDSGITTADWLRQMKADGCIEDLVHSVKVPVPVRRADYLLDIERMIPEMNAEDETPRYAGCFGFSRCPFWRVCHGSREPIPEKYGFQLIEPSELLSAGAQT